MNRAEVLDVLVAVPVLLAGIYLVGLAAVAIVSPQRAKLFLASFASSAFAHFAEMVARLIVGAALILHAPKMKFSDVFVLLGWVIVVTTIVLMAVPWKWHRRFANWSVPIATRNMTLLGFGSLVGGLFVLLSFFLGPGLE